MKEYSLMLTEEEAGDLLEILYESRGRSYINHELYLKIDKFLDSIYADEALKNIPLPEESI